MSISLPGGICDSLVIPYLQSYISVLTMSEDMVLEGVHGWEHPSPRALTEGPWIGSEL